MVKRVLPDHPIHELIATRWSPYAFDSRPVSRADAHSLFEAGRWAASSYNEQPWQYLVATRDEPEEFAKLLSCLVEGNQVWAKAAPLLAISAASLSFKLNGKPNKAAIHDLGLAACSLTFEATARGLAVHQMIGILPERVRELYGIPDGYEAVTALAIGYVGDPSRLPDKLKERDLAPRARRPLKEFVFSGRWGRASALVG
ncbi:MAG: nitroreductase family protein [Candidatus Omnitrophota bacterium]|nr:nitroreductase family protein [Candidatus Omnitrophota bacterium]